MPGHNPYGNATPSPPLERDPDAPPLDVGVRLGDPVNPPAWDPTAEVRNAAAPVLAISGTIGDEPMAYQATAAALLDLVRQAGDVRGLEVQRAYSPDGETWPADPATLDWSGVQGVYAGDDVGPLDDEHVLGLVSDDYQPDPSGLGDPIFRLVARFGDESEDVPGRPLFYGYALPLALLADDGSIPAGDPQAVHEPGENPEDLTARLIVGAHEVPENAADVVSWVREHPLGSVLRHARALAAAEAETARAGDPRSTVDAVIVETLAHPVDVEDTDPGTPPE